MTAQNVCSCGHLLDEHDYYGCLYLGCGCRKRHGSEDGKPAPRESKPPAGVRS